MPITPSLRHCSNKYKLAREGEKGKEKDVNIEKGKDLFFMMMSSSVESVIHFFNAKNKNEHNCVTCMSCISIIFLD